MGHWCLTKSNYLIGWLVFRCVEWEERILSAPKKREVLLNLAKRKQSSKIGCVRRLLVKNGTKINSPVVASVAVISSLGKHVFSKEFFKETTL